MGTARAKALRQDRAWRIEEMCSNTVRRREARRDAVRAAGQTIQVMDTRQGLECSKCSGVTGTVESRSKATEQRSREDRGAGRLACGGHTQTVSVHNSRAPR